MGARMVKYGISQRNTVTCHSHFEVICHHHPSVLPKLASLPKFLKPFCNPKIVNR